MRLRHLLVLLLAAWPALLAAQPPETFSEQVFVREMELIVDLPDVLQDNGWHPGDFQVLVDGQPREVTRVEPVADAADPRPWTVVVYVDEVLASPGTVFYASLSLAEHASALTGLGNVEVVTAGSDPAVVLPATREATRVDEVLTALSGKARVERDQGLKRPALPVSRQLEKLVAFLTARRVMGPRVLFLVADGIEVTPAESALLEGESNGNPEPGSPAAAFRETARLLAAYGWVTVAVPLRREGLGRGVSTMSDVNRIRMNSRGPSEPPVILASPRSTPLAYEGVIDVLVEARSAALRALARPTTGTVVGYDVQLGPLLGDLTRRWRIWVAAPDTVDGRVRPVEVRLPGRSKDVRAQAWVRSSTPEGVAEARLRNLLAGEPPGGGLPLEAEARETAPSTLEVRITTAPYKAAGSATPGPVRISYAFAGADGTVRIRHELVPASDVAERGFRHTARVDLPPGTRQVAVAVEDLSTETWNGRILR
jgi:hypothetical protein